MGCGIRPDVGRNARSTTLASIQLVGASEPSFVPGEQGKETRVSTVVREYCPARLRLSLPENSTRTARRYGFRRFPAKNTPLDYSRTSYSPMKSAR